MSKKNNNKPDVNQFGEDKDLQEKNNSKKRLLIGVLAFFAISTLITLAYYYLNNNEYPYSIQVGENPLTDNLKPNNSNKQDEGATDNVGANPFNINTTDIESATKTITGKEAAKPTSPFPLKEPLLKAEMEKINTGITDTKISINELNNNISNITQAQNNYKNELHSGLKKVEENTQTVINSFVNKISSIFKKDEAKNKEEKQEASKQFDIFELIGISLWDSRPQATIRFQGKMSIVDEGSVRIGWKVAKIDFDKEQIVVVKNGQQITLEKIK